MKNIAPSLLLALALGGTSLSAQSCAATRHFAAASTHAANASGEVLAAGAASAAGSVQSAAAVVAVPVWMSGAAVSGAGAVSTVIGDATASAGTALGRGGDKLWDFASGDPAKRPALDDTHPVMPAASNPARDPSPAEAFKRL